MSNSKSNRLPNYCA
uniref:Uncharacterized protein n=1 Tax=Arundo donax TaxID=35708 RepID=A0A0A9CKM1_ARUDO